MSEAEDFLPAGWTPSEELMGERADCRTCGRVAKTDARAWAATHVQLTGHTVRFELHYDVRDENWEARLPYERLAEIEALVGRRK